MDKPKQYVVCVSNTNYEASLVVRRIYEAIPDSDVSVHELLRVVDDSGEAYLFPEILFEAIDLPTALRRKLALTT